MSMAICLGMAVADVALSSMALQKNSTPVTQPSLDLIWQSWMILPFEVLTTMLLQWKRAILFPYESL